MDLSSLASLIPPLPAQFTQGTRLLRIHSALGADTLLVESFSGREALDEGFRFEVEVLSTDAHIELKKLNGQSVLVELLTAQSRSDLRPFHGHVTQASCLGADGGFARYRLVVEPWFAFLRYRRDSFVFQDMSVPQIADAIFADYANGPLAPVWRWELKDEHVPRSLCIQYEETDLDFVSRLLAEEGLFFWFEHAGDASSAPFGTHTLVIADHNGACPANAQPRVPYRRTDATESQDTVQRIGERRNLATNRIELSTWDYRTLATLPVSASSAGAEGEIPLTAIDHPGQYTYADADQGERYARLHTEALAARARGYTLAATLRSAAPATRLSVDFEFGQDRRPLPEALLVIAVTHTATNNLAAHGGQAKAERAKTPLYQCTLEAIDADTPWRPLTEDGHGARLHPKPTAQGLQTAMVVGQGGSPLTACRDGRIKVQFHWQRGAKSHSQLDHPAETNAGSDETTGTWVRVLAPQAGANWGGHFTPRIGQEVLVDFMEGDIDRPLVIGAAYNGRGQDNAQANGTGASVGTVTANAPAWFPGSAKEGDLESHAHQAVFSGFKTQALGSSQSGQGGYNALLFDETPGQSGLRLSTTQFSTQLSLGHHKHQADNRRLADRGHGADLRSEAYGAVRAGSGLLVSADARPNVSSSQMDSREAIAQLTQSEELAKTLADTAQKHNAKLPSEPEPAKLPAIDSAHRAGEALQATDTRGAAAAAGAGGFVQTSGGSGTVPAWSSPLMTFSAPGGIGLFTPKDAVLASGNAFSVAAGQDANLVAQGNVSVAVKAGISLFSYGKAGNGQKPNQETGIRLHAASGSVSMQSQSDETQIAADKKVTVASTSSHVQLAAKEHVMLTAAGAAIKVEGGNISLIAPGSVTFHASQKNLAGPASASTSLSLKKAGALSLCELSAATAAQNGDATVALG